MNTKEEVLASFALLKEELKTKTEDENMGPPELIRIEHDDYHAEYIGRTATGLQFFFPPIFGKHEYITLFLFNDDGDLVESRIEDLGPRTTFDPEKARSIRDKWLEELKPEFEDIVIKPFAVECDGEMMGLIPTKHNDYWVAEVHPGNVMAFSKPWDRGDYDT